LLASFIWLIKGDCPTGWRLYAGGMLDTDDLLRIQRSLTSMNQLTLLYILVQRPEGMDATSLGEFCRLQVSTVESTAKRLEDLGFLSRELHATRRVRWYHATERGILLIRNETEPRRAAASEAQHESRKRAANQPG
jgi:DNA-binding MarR family transcriptional regulator